MRKSPITITEWHTNHHAVIDEYFSDQGLGRYSKTFMKNDDQIAYAKTIADACINGETNPGLVVPIEAETGIGKSHGYLAVALLNAVLTGKRSLISTFTNLLKSQVTYNDGKTACETVAWMTGKYPILARYYAYSEFASPTYCRMLAARIENEQNDEGSKKPIIEALRNLADWTDRELDEIENIKKRNPSEAHREVVENRRGTITSWASQNEHFMFELPKNDADLWALDARCPEREHAIREIYMNNVDRADCIICSHALLTIDMKLNGTILGERKYVAPKKYEIDPFGLTIIDEAHRMEDAARSALGQKTSIRSIEYSIEAVKKTLLEIGFEEDDEFFIKIIEKTNQYSKVIEDLKAVSDNLSIQNLKNKPRKTKIPVIGTEPWLSTLMEASSAAFEIGNLLNDLDIDLRAKKTSRGIIAGAIETTENKEHYKLVSTANDLIARSEKIDFFVTTATMTDKTKQFGKTWVSFSPVFAEPSIFVDAKHGSRVLRRLWQNYPGNEPLSLSTILTSATIAHPGSIGKHKFEAIERMYGLDLTPGAFDTEHAAFFEPKKFGKVSYVLAHPDAPLPAQIGIGTLDQKEIEKEREETEKWSRYIASAIAEAAKRNIETKKRIKILVLTTSFRDTKNISEALGALHPELMQIVIERNENMSIQQSIDIHKKNKNSILITPGAWEGVDLPKEIDHLLIPRLPMTPPDDGYGAPIIYYDEKEGIIASRDVDKMGRRFRQGMGRLIRRHDDEGTIWILDPRFGLPDDAQIKAKQISHYNGKGRFYHMYIPKRFRRNFDEADIFFWSDPMDPKKKDKKAA